MGIYDVYELQKHREAIVEYMLYLDSHESEYRSVSFWISDHLKNMKKILDSLEKVT